MEDLGKLTVAKGLKKLPKVKKSPNLVTRSRLNQLITLLAVILGVFISQPIFFLQNVMKRVLLTMTTTLVESWDFSLWKVPLIRYFSSFVPWRLVFISSNQFRFTFHFWSALIILFTLTWQLVTDSSNRLFVSSTFQRRWKGCRYLVCTCFMGSQSLRFGKSWNMLI